MIQTEDIKLGIYYDFSNEDYNNASMCNDFEKIMINKIICNAYYNITNNGMGLIMAFGNSNVWINSQAKTELFNFCRNDFCGAVYTDGMYQYWANKETSLPDITKPITDTDRKVIAKELIERFFSKNINISHKL